MMLHLSEVLEDFTPEQVHDKANKDSFCFYFVADLTTVTSPPSPRIFGDGPAAVMADGLMLVWLLV